MQIIKKNLMLIIYAIIIIHLSKDIFLINTSDFARAVFPFIDGVKSFSKENTLIFPFKNNFQSISHYNYISSYSYMLYAYAYVVSIFTNFLDMRLLSAVLKGIYIFVVYKLYLHLTVEKKIASKFLFVIFSLVLFSSSNLSMFNSFYQEQVLLIFLPLTMLLIHRDDNKGIYSFFLVIGLISTSKSQFAFTPLIFIIYYSLFYRNRLRLRVGLSLACLLLSMLCILFSKGAVNLNKYHSSYYGAYQLMQNKELILPDNVDADCVGVDAWGNKYDNQKGAVHTDIGMTCFNNKKFSFDDTISVFLKNPSLLITLPYDKGIRQQYTENYIHVYNSFLLIENNSGLLYDITKIKDFLFKEIRFSALLLAFFSSFFLRNKKVRGVIFFLSAFGTSQLYISFLGEGYRDLSKHLFGMNISFDLLLFTVICILSNRLQCTIEKSVK